MKKKYVWNIIVVIGLVSMSTGYLFAQESFLQTKRNIIQEVYSNEAYLPLIDIQQATIELNALKTSLDRIQDQASLREEQQETIYNRARQLRIAIATILKDSEGTEKTIARTLQSLAITKKKIGENEQKLSELKQDQFIQREVLKQYLRFMYIANNAYLVDDEIASVRLLLGEEGFAASLSQKDFVALLSQKIVSLLGKIESSELLVADLIKTLQKDAQEYTQEGLTLKEHMHYLEQQKTSVYELMAYLQKESTQLESQVGRIQESEQAMSLSKQALERVIAQSEGVHNSELYELIDQDDRAQDNNFYTWPFVGQPIVTQRREQSQDGVRFDLEQGTPLYSPVAGVVHKVFRSESAELSWVVLLHKDGYATFFSPLSKVYVQSGDLVKRGQLIGESGGKPGTRGAGFDSTQPYLEMTVKKSGKPIDPLTVLDLSVFEEDDIVGRYQKDYIQDQGVRQVYVSALDRMKGDTLMERVYEFLRIYATGPFANPTLRFEGSKNTGINPVLGMCIGFAETSFKNFKTPNNIGNVGNDDRGRTVTFETPTAGVAALFNVFNNQYLGDYTLLSQLSRFGNQDGFIYASSGYNRQKNIMNCLTSIYGYRIPEDFPFRVPIE